jgi:AcrR family transcriptional regulator
VTTKEIAESAGVSMSVMYRHFPAKTDLFREVTLVPLITAIEEYLAIRQIAAMVFGTIAFDRWLLPPGATNDRFRFLDSLTQLAVWGLARRAPDGYDEPSPKP